MKTVRITEAFTGYPNGKRREFQKGDELEFSNEYADLVVRKGLGTDVTPKPAPPRAPHKPEPDPETAD